VPLHLSPRHPPRLGGEISAPASHKGSKNLNF
jgi:hypothetical protein